MKVFYDDRKLLMDQANPQALLDDIIEKSLSMVGINQITLSYNTSLLKRLIKYQKTKQHKNQRKPK